MKRTIQLFVIAVFLVHAGYSQNTQVYDFERINEPMYLNEANSEVESLEKQGYYIKGTKGMIITGENSSDVRVNKNPTFLIKLPDTEIAAGLELHELIPYKKEARLKYFKDPKGLAENKITPSLESLEDDVYRIGLPTALDPGEYVIFLGQTCYRFGVD